MAPTLPHLLSRCAAGLTTLPNDAISGSEHACRLTKKNMQAGSSETIEAQADSQGPSTGGNATAARVSMPSPARRNISFAAGVGGSSEPWLTQPGDTPQAAPDTRLYASKAPGACCMLTHAGRHAYCLYAPTNACLHVCAFLSMVCACRHAPPQACTRQHYSSSARCCRAGTQHDAAQRVRHSRARSHSTHRHSQLCTVRSQFIAAGAAAASSAS